MVALLERITRPSANLKRVRAQRFEGPGDSLAILVGGLDVDVGVRIHPRDFFDYALDADGFRRIVLGLKRVMREQRRSQKERGQNLLHVKDGIRNSALSCDLVGRTS